MRTHQKAEAGPSSQHAPWQAGPQAKQTSSLQSDNAKKLVKLLGLELWHSAFGKSTCQEGLSSKMSRVCSRRKTKNLPVGVLESEDERFSSASFLLRSTEALCFREWIRRILKRQALFTKVPCALVLLYAASISGPALWGLQEKTA